MTFLLLSMWFRYTIAALHQFTYPPVIFGLSIAAVTSVAVVAIGIAVVGGRRLLLRRLLPVYAMILTILVSALVNQAWIGALNATVKWLYLTVLAVAAFVALSRRGPNRVFGSLSFVFIGPIALQWFSVAMGVDSTNQDRSLSFIGGYEHQQAFSIIMLTFLFVTCFTYGISTKSSYVRLAVAAAGLVLANYRTVMLASLLPAAALALARLVDHIVPKQRAVALLLFGAMSLFVFVGIAQLAQSRFADLGAVAQKGSALIQPPEDFTSQERRLFSGRVYLWSLYIDAYRRGSITEKLVGFGPDAWVGRFFLYAHNTFISDLYELGLFGLAAFIALLGANMAAAVSVVGEHKVVLIACHIGFIILNLATMAVWTIEGDILYALLLGQTWHLHGLAFRGADGIRRRLLSVRAARPLQADAMTRM